MSQTNEVVDISTIVDLYVQKVSLEATQLIASLTMEVMVMHTVGGIPDEGWDKVVLSAQKIVEFIDLFCKKSRQKISLLALVVIDKLQGAHNRFLEAAQTTSSSITAKEIIFISAKLLEQSAKFYTYALTAERMGQNNFRALYIEAGESFAKYAAQKHHEFESSDISTHLVSMRKMKTKSEEQCSIGNTRGSKIYVTLAHYYKALAAIAINNFDNNAMPVPNLRFHNPGLWRVYRMIESQLHTISRYVSEGALWQAEVLLWDLENNDKLLDPNTDVAHTVSNMFTDVEILVESGVVMSPDKDFFLNDWSNSFSPPLIVHILRMGLKYFHHYIKLLQDLQFLNKCLVESQVKAHSLEPPSTPFSRRLWRYIHSFATRRKSVTNDAIESFLSTAKSRSDAERTVLHAENAVLKDWLRVAAVLDNARTCLCFYGRQVQTVRQDRPAKVVEVVIRAWRCAQSCMEQLVKDLEFCVCRDDSIVSNVPLDETQDAYDLACLRAVTYARIAQALYQDTAGIYTESRIALQWGELQSSESLTNIMIHLAILSEKRLVDYDTVPPLAEAEPTYAAVVARIAGFLRGAMASRQDENLHAAELLKAKMYRTAYRLRVQYMWYEAKGTFSHVVLHFFPHFNLLQNLARKEDIARYHKAIDYLLLYADTFIRCGNLPPFECISLSDVGRSYAYAGSAQFLLSKMTVEEFQSNEDVSITLARMRVDRHRCNALIGLESFDRLESMNEAGETLGLDVIGKRFLVHKVVKQTVEKHYRNYIGSNDKLVSIMTWEYAIVKEAATQYTPESAHIFEVLQDYGYKPSELQKSQISEYIATCQQMWICYLALQHTGKPNDAQSATWWKCAEKALEHILSHIYSYCFEAGPKEDILHAKNLYDAVSKCAAACDEGKTLHPSCNELAELALTEFKARGDSIDSAARAQHAKLTGLCTQFLAAAAIADSEQMEKMLTAVELQKRVLRDLLHMPDAN